MKHDYKLNAKKRLITGKGASRRLRRSNEVPAIIYGAGKTSEMLTLDHNEIFRALENEKFYSHILSLMIDGKDEQVVLKDLQRHPYLPRITHADFLRISATEKIIMQIPLHFLGEELAPGVKIGGGVVSHLANEVTIKCLPADLPEAIDVDVSKLELNQAIHLSDLKLPKGAEIPGLIIGTDSDKTILTVYIPREVVEPVEAAAPVPAEVETLAEVKAKEKAAEEAAMADVPGGKPSAKAPAKAEKPATKGEKEKSDKKG